MLLVNLHLLRLLQNLMTALNQRTIFIPAKEWCQMWRTPAVQTYKSKSDIFPVGHFNAHKILKSKLRIEDMNSVENCVCISRNWKNFIKNIYTYSLRWFLFMSLHTAQTQCTLYTVIILYTVLEHVLLRCATLNSKIYMTTMNNESYCCLLISLSWKKFDEAPLKIIDKKIKCNNILF